MRVLDEVEAAIGQILKAKEVADADDRATRARAFMEEAFADAMVHGYEKLLAACADLPDQNDAHVLAAALKTQAAIIVTDNLRHFPVEVLGPLNLEAKSTDAFLANTIALNPGAAVAAVRQMRERLRRPEKSGAALLIDMEAAGLVQTVDVLRAHQESL